MLSSVTRVLCLKLLAGVKAAAVVLLLAFPTVSTAAMPSREMTRAEIDSVLWTALDAHAPYARKLSLIHFEFGDRDRWYPRFRVFEAIWAGLPKGSVNVGFYAVDPLTADVWDGVVCQEITSPKLQQIQRRIRHRLGLSASRYRRMRVLGPECE